jgi:hypothetical protein
MKTGLVIIDARKDREWLGKAKEALAKLLPLYLTGDEEQIAEFLECPEFLRYKNFMCAKAGNWRAEGTLSIEPPSEL